MKIAIHNSLGSYSERWIEYCREHQIEYKIVNAYDTDIIDQLRDCNAFMWHHHQADYRDALFAKQLLFSLEQAGKVVFPDFHTGWHFDDKLGQKYLFEANGIQAAPAFAFYTRKDAFKWIESATFPKIFKLRGGAGSANVLLAKSKRDAYRFVKKSFGNGWSFFSGWRYFKDQWKFFTNRKISSLQLVKSFGRIFIPTEAGRMLPVHKGYVYFQEFIRNEGFDYRIEICGDRCIAMVRYVRKGDFRASGGHNDHFDKDLIPQDVILFAFEVAEKLKLQACALDIVREKDSGKLYVIENSYCYGVDADEFDHGYWDRQGLFHNEKFNGLDWMIELVIDKVKQKKVKNMF